MAGLSCGACAQVRYSSSNPFIGKLSLQFLEVSHTRHGELFLTSTAHLLHALIMGTLMPQAVSHEAI